MKVAIIGAGRMGKWFANLFAKEGMHVILSDKDKSKLLKTAEELNVEAATCNTEAVKRADRILICVPIENFEELVAEIHQHIKPGQEVMDICSVKEKPVEVMHRYIKNGVVLGTHPMFGPGVKDLKDQNFILTPTRPEEEELAENFGKWLKSKGAKVFKMTPTEHDKLMSIVIGLPYFLSIVACDTVLSHGYFSEAKKVAGASYKFLITLVEAIVSEDEEFSAGLQMSLPEMNIVGELFIKKAMEWIEIIKQGRKHEYARKIGILKERLEVTDPEYKKAYEDMYRMLEVLKNRS
ncbi:MAG: prephenate dehydrogenase/arogenate dehydrogenase family protein [Candidatus Bathyarchaeia archaeon]